MLTAGSPKMARHGRTINRPRMAAGGTEGPVTSTKEPGWPQTRPEKAPQGHGGHPGDWTGAGEPAEPTMESRYLQAGVGGHPVIHRQARAGIPLSRGLSRARKFPLDNEMGKKFSAVISEKNPVIRLSGYPRAGAPNGSPLSRRSLLSTKIPLDNRISKKIQF